MNKKHLYSLILSLCTLGCIWLLSHLQYLSTHSKEVVLCPIKLVSTYPCPACGTTAACLEILEGNFLRAIYINPLGYLALLALGILPIWILTDIIRKSDSFFVYYQQIENNIKQSWLIKILLIVLILSIWLRNLLNHNNITS